MLDGAWFPAHPDRQTVRVKELIQVNARGVSPSAGRGAAFTRLVATTFALNFHLSSGKRDAFQGFAEDQQPGKEPRGHGEEEGFVKCGWSFEVQMSKSRQGRSEGRVLL